MYIIIALRDGDITKAIPIMSAEENDCMSLFETEQEANEFCEKNLLCQHSENVIIDVENWSIDFR